jgi:hypothetical protein
MGILIEVVGDHQVLVTFVDHGLEPPADHVLEHRGRARSKCPKCPKTFATLHGLEVHIARAHKGEGA